MKLQKVISNIVSTDQNGYIRNRFIGYSIRQIQDIIDYAEDSNLDGILLFLDYQKAFDSIEWRFMNMTLEKFGFGLNFQNAIKMLYKNANNSVINNGWVSERFPISRGIRQGCPISALLYILSAEIMAENIRNNNRIRGIKIGRHKEIKLTQLADDTTIFLQSENSIPILIEELKRFSAVSERDYYLGEICDTYIKFTVLTSRYLELNLLEYISVQIGKNVCSLTGTN